MSEPDPQPEPAQVLERWNSWVRVWFPSSGGSGWINLDEVGWEQVLERPLAETPPRPEVAPRLDPGLDRHGAHGGRGSFGALP